MPIAINRRNQFWGNPLASREQGPILQAFIPFSPSWDDSLSGFSAISPAAMPRCPLGNGNGSRVKVLVGDHDIGKLLPGMVSLNRVSEGDELCLVLDGNREYRQPISADGMVLCLRLPAALALIGRQLASSPTGGVRVAVRGQDGSGKWKISNHNGPSFRERCFFYDRVELAALYIVPQNGDPGTSLAWIE